MKGHHLIALRLGVMLAVCIAGCASIVSHRSVDAASAQAPRALPGPIDHVYADPANLMYSSGPSEIERWSLQAANGFASNITVTYDAGFTGNPPAQAAFQAAIDIWKSVISSPAPIRVSAFFKNLGNPNILGSAAPTAVCTTNKGLPNTGYSAALADKLNGSAFCATLDGETHEITANFNSTFTNWDFGTSGIPVSAKYSFLTVALHELGHGLGFRGTMRASSGIGSFGYTPPSIVDIFDRFAVTGGGVQLIGFMNPSAALGAQLVSNNTFFDGANATVNDGGLWPMIETHNFTASYGVTSDNGFLQGSSYSHVDDVLYTGTPNGLMTWRLAQAEVYTDPGPIVRGMFADMGWTITSSCSYSLSSSSPFSAGAASTSSTINVTTSAGCGWTAVSNASWITITSGSSGTGSGTVSYSVSANTGGVRTGTMTIAGQSFTVTQAARGRSGDFDGDGKADITVFRPLTGTWYVRGSSAGATYLWGSAGDIPVAGDYDGDGKTDIAVFRPWTGAWYIVYSSTMSGAVVTWGSTGDVPVLGDYDGDGKTDIAVFRPWTGTWYIRGSSASATYVWGSVGDVPVAGDYDGDGKTDIAVFRPSTGAWYILYSGTMSGAVVTWGSVGDVPVPGDYDGDGKTDIAVFRPSTGTWYIRGSSVSVNYVLGDATDIPVPGDYDGDGKTDIAVFRPSTGTWYLVYSSTLSGTAVTWGGTGDIPILKHP